MRAVPPDNSRPPPRRRLRLLVLALCAFGGLLLVEGVARFLLFGESEFAREQGRPYRQPGLFADSQLEDAHWLLMRKLTPPGRKITAPPHDSLVGWVNGKIEPGTYEHRDAAQLGDRRPFLMYGASYAQGLESGETDGESFSEEFGFLNYGVGGFGVDQAYLMLRETLDRYANRNPVVALGLVADSDFDRCILSFRSLPKPRLVLRNGLLEPDGPVFAGGPDAYLDQYGTGITSYAWSYVLCSQGLLPAAWRHRLAGRTKLRAEQDELIEAIVLATRDECERRGIDYEFVLFSSPGSMPPRKVSAREEMLITLFETHEIPYCRMRDELTKAATAMGIGIEAFFIQDGVRKNHPNELGNRVILSALRERAADFAGGAEGAAR